MSSLSLKLSKKLEERESESEIPVSVEHTLDFEMLRFNVMDLWANDDGVSQTSLCKTNPDYDA